MKEILQNLQILILYQPASNLTNLKCLNCATFRPVFGLPDVSRNYKLKTSQDGHIQSFWGAGIDFNIIEAFLLFSVGDNKN